MISVNPYQAELTDKEKIDTTVEQQNAILRNRFYNSTYFIRVIAGSGLMALPVICVCAYRFYTNCILCERYERYEHQQQSVASVASIASIAPAKIKSIIKTSPVNTVQRVSFSEDTDHVIHVPESQGQLLYLPTPHITLLNMKPLRVQANAQ